MLFLRSLFAVAVVSLFASTSSFALDRCESGFQRGLIDMKALFTRMSPACQKEVNLGDTNEDQILAKCSSTEISMALEMQSIENSRMKPLCMDDTCTRLQARGVCVEGKPFSFYLGKFNL